MNIQIFGTRKSFDTKKAERYFKERKIPYQFVDRKEKGLSKGELTSVMQAVGSLEVLLDDRCKDQQTLAPVSYTHLDVYKRQDQSRTAGGFYTADRTRAGTTAAPV